MYSRDAMIAPKRTDIYSIDIIVACSTMHSNKSRLIIRASCVSLCQHQAFIINNKSLGHCLLAGSTKTDCQESLL